MPFLILVIIICMIVALFAVQNAVAVSLNFVFWSFSASLVLVILGAFLMGVLVATCFLLTIIRLTNIFGRMTRSSRCVLRWKLTSRAV